MSSRKSVEGIVMKAFDMARLFDLLAIAPADLLLRSYGQRAFPVLEAELLAVPAGSVLTLDFGSVRVMDASFADETILQLLSKLTVGSYGDRFVIIERPASATVDNLEGAIARRREKLALLVRKETSLQVVGHVERNLIETWHLVAQAGTMTARDLADRLGLEISTASTRLHKLHQMRLLARREEIVPSGRQHTYALPM
jgi:hypothetical protein